MKKAYASPKVEINRFEEQDVILTSGAYSTNATQGAFVEIERCNAEIRRREDENK